MAAVLAMQIAHELEPECRHYLEDLERLMRRIPLVLADILQVGHQQRPFCYLYHIVPKQADEHKQLSR